MSYHGSICVSKQHAMSECWFIWHLGHTYYGFYSYFSHQMAFHVCVCCLVWSYNDVIRHDTKTWLAEQYSTQYSDLHIMYYCIADINRNRNNSKFEIAIKLSFKVGLSAMRYFKPLWLIKILMKKAFKKSFLYLKKKTWNQRKLPQ